MKLGKKKKVVVSVESLLEKGNNALNMLQPELARKFYERALQLSPDDTGIMDGLADISIQLGDNESAVELLKQSTLKAPESNAVKWLFLAQLQQGHDALTSYNAGINILLNSLNSLENESDSVILHKKQISKAYCSIAELYLTDLCYDDNAEGLSEQAVQKALNLFPDLVDAKQTLASIRISQGRIEQACELICEVYMTIMRIREKIRSRTVLDEIDGNDIDFIEDSPETEFCITTTKLLVECGSLKPDLIRYAIDLVTGLLEEDDENIELWYIAGIASLTMVPPDSNNARYYLEKAKFMMEELRSFCGSEGTIFPYNEQYDLLLDHLKILDSTDNKSTINDMIIEDDEEWSSVDEAEID